MHLLSTLLALHSLISLSFTLHISSPSSPLVPRAPSGKDNCKGSFFCDEYAVRKNCDAAIARFQDDKDYPAYASCISTDADKTFLSGCTAMYVCEGLYYANIKGKRIKELFSLLYAGTGEEGGVGCGGCGSKYFTETAGDGTPLPCRVTANYCESCNDVNCGGFGSLTRRNATDDGLDDGDMVEEKTKA